MRWSEKKETSSSSFNWIDVFLLDTSKLSLPDVRKRTVQFLPLFLGIFCKSREREGEGERGRKKERKKRVSSQFFFFFVSSNQKVRHKKMNKMNDD